MNTKTFAGNREIWGGGVLLGAAILALIINNTGGEEWYHNLWSFQLKLGFFPLSITKSLHHWVNDGLMALFFVLVGIEIQREVKEGSLRTPQNALLPLLAAVGGFIGPALVYGVATQGFPTLQQGWGIPAATDIAFVIALASMLKKNITPGIRIFLLALATADDVLAVVAIAIFYSSSIIWLNLIMASVGVGLIVAKNRFGVQWMWVYGILGLLIWLCIMLSGVHATIAGVVVGLLLPLKGEEDKESPASIVQRLFDPWVRWAILPLFAFANMGITLHGLTAEDWKSPVAIGIIFGLVMGKWGGIVGTIWALSRFFNIPKPEGASWKHIHGMGFLCGVGFTMSLFITPLALPEIAHTQARLGIMVGSFASALIGWMILTGRPSRISNHIQH